MTPFRLAILDLTRKRIPTLTAVLSIAVAVACAGVLLKLFFLSQARFQTLAHDGLALAGAKSGGIEILLGAMNLEGDFPDFIPHRLYESISQRQEVRFEDGTASDPSEVQAVIPFIYFGDMQAGAQSFRVIGTRENFINRPVAGDSLSFASGGWVGESTPEVVVGSEVARQAAILTGDTVRIRAAGLTGEVAAPEFPATVTGVLRPTGKSWDYALYSSLSAGQQLVAMTPHAKSTIWGTEVLHYFLIYMDPSGFREMKSLINERTVAQLISIPEEIRKLENLTGTGRGFGLLLMGLILFLGGSSVATLMITRFEAMSVQIAVLRALGYGRGEVTAWLLWEGALLGGAACLLGGLIDFLVFPVVREAAGLGTVMVQGNLFLQTLLVWAAALLATTAAIGVPLLRVSRQNIHSSLKG